MAPEHGPATPAATASLAVRRTERPAPALVQADHRGDHRPGGDGPHRDLVDRPARVRLWTSRRRPGDALGVRARPNRARVDAEWRLRRQHEVEQTHEVLTRFYDNTTEEMRELFRVAAMDPEHGLIRWGRGAEAFLISPQVFEPDEHGRSYRMRPDTRSVWLRQITLHHGPFGMFQVLDTPKHRAAAMGRRDRRRGLGAEHQLLGPCRRRAGYDGHRPGYRPGRFLHVGHVQRRRRDPHRLS